MPDMRKSSPGRKRGAASKAARQRAAASQQSTEAANAAPGSATGVVALIVPRSLTRTDPETLVQLTQALADQHLHALTFAIDTETSLVAEQVEAQSVDGIITAARLQAEDLERLLQLPVPAVCFNCYAADPRLSSVRCDQQAGARWLVNALAGGNHRSVGLVTGPPDSTAAAERAFSALQALKDLALSDVSLAEADGSYASGRAALRQLHAERGGVPDAVLATNDLMAMGCIDEARQGFGLAVPEQLSVLGFDGIASADLAAYGLTTVRQPLAQMAERAVALLLASIADPGHTAQEALFAGIPVQGRSARIGA
jgi:DNA-binding LacI/PurR family transcriptional regulator